MANNSGTRAPIILASQMTLRPVISSILSNTLNIFVNLFPTLIACFQKTSAIAMATLPVETHGMFIHSQPGKEFRKYAKAASPKYLSFDPHIHFKQFILILYLHLT